MGFLATTTNRLAGLAGEQSSGRGGRKPRQPLVLELQNAGVGADDAGQTRRGGRRCACVGGPFRAAAVAG